MNFSDLKTLRDAILETNDEYATEKDHLTERELEELSELLPELQLMLHLIEELFNALESNNCIEEIWKCFESLLVQAKKASENTKTITPVLKSRIVELTDGGPGVGISNNNVRIRIAQTVRITSADFLYVTICQTMTVVRMKWKDYKAILGTQYVMEVHYYGV